MANLQEYIKNNEAFAASFDKEKHGTKPMPPARKAAIITCERTHNAAPIL